MGRWSRHSVTVCAFASWASRPSSLPVVNVLNWEMEEFCAPCALSLRLTHTQSQKHTHTHTHTHTCCSNSAAFLRYQTCLPLPRSLHVLLSAPHWVCTLFAPEAFYTPAFAKKLPRRVPDWSGGGLESAGEMRGGQDDLLRGRGVEKRRSYAAKPRRSAGLLEGTHRNKCTHTQSAEKSQSHSWEVESGCVGGMAV